MLSLSDGDLLSDPIMYRIMVEALQYLTMTTPDIRYVMKLVFQFIHALRTTHLSVVQHIFRYLQGTTDLSLTLCKAKSLSLVKK